jgi:hypothetical protein
VNKEASMKKARTLIIAVAVLGAITAGNALAQRGMKWRGSGGWGPASNYGRMYDPKTVVTLQGEVLSVDTFTPSKGMTPGVHLMVKTAEGTESVHLGPEWYISGQDIKVAEGDKIEVTGSRITFDGKPAIIAAKVTKSDEVLRLRDESGFPAWAGWRRRR